MSKIATMSPYGIIPVPDDLTHPYWDGAGRGVLVIQRCQKCGFYNHPPVYLCAGCKDREAPLAFEDMSGRGNVYIFYMAHDASIGGFEEKVPYPVIIVEMEEQPGLFIMSNLLNCEHDSRGGGIEIGMPVEAVFQAADNGITMVQFHPVRG